MAWFYAVNIAFMIGMTNLILVIHLERKIAARIQDRRGPMLSFRSFRAAKRKDILQFISSKPLVRSLILALSSTL